MRVNQSVNMVISLQIVSSEINIPTTKQFDEWIKAIFIHLPKPLLLPKKLTVNIRIIDIEESTHLNETFRHKKGPTNVLSFPSESIPGFSDLNHLGDLAICAPLVKSEALEQEKDLYSHWAHLTIHGVLHLLGYDHIKKKEAVEMENLEILILKDLDIANPYV